MDLGFLAPLYATSTPVASAYLDTTRAFENADHEITVRWQGLRAELSRQGADETTLKAMDSVAGGVTGLHGRHGEAVFASEGRVLGVHTLSRPPQGGERANWLPVPDPLELVTDLDDALPYVIVASDRVGADVWAYNARGELDEERSFNGITLHIQKVREGGMAHKHYQRRAEEVWSENAAQVAQDVEAAVRDVDAHIIFVGGDERAMGKLREHLTERAAAMVVPLSGGRGGTDAMAALHESASEGLRETAIALRSDVYLDFTSDLERGRAVQGREATMAALRAGQVSKLLLAPERGGEPDAWSTTDPMEVSEQREQLAAPENAFAAPASALLIRAACASGAALTTLASNGDATDGVGALLRYTMAE